MMVCMDSPDLAAKSRSVSLVPLLILTVALGIFIPSIQERAAWIKGCLEKKKSFDNFYRSASSRLTVFVEYE